MFVSVIVSFAVAASGLNWAQQDTRNTARHDYKFEARFEDGKLKDYLIDARSISLVDVFREMTVTAHNTVDMIDEFEPVDLRFKGAELKEGQLLAFLAMHAKFVRHELPASTKDNKIYAFWNVGRAPLSGQVQIFKLGKSWCLRANAAPVDEILDDLKRYAVPVWSQFAAAVPKDPYTGELKSDSPEGLVLSFQRATKLFWTNFKPDETENVTEAWPLTFVGSDSPSFNASTGTVSKPDDSKSKQRISDMASELNAVYGDKSVTARGRNLFVSGTPAKVKEIKRALATWIDVPYPTVRLDVWAYQGSERKHTAQDLVDRINLINTGIQMVREFGRAYTRDLDRFVAKREFDNDITSSDSRFDNLRSLFFEFGLAGLPDEKVPSTWKELKDRERRVKPFADNLAYMCLMERSGFETAIATSFNEHESEALPALKETLAGIDSRIKKTEEGSSYPERKRDLEILKSLKELGSMVYLSAGGTDASLSSFPRFQRYRRDAFRSFSSLFVKTDAVADVQSVFDFLTAYRSVQRLEDSVSPERLTILAANVDTMMTNVSEIVATDVRQATIRPLLDWIESVSRSGKQGNPTLILTGNSSIAVNSSRPGLTEATTVSNFPFTPSNTADAEKLFGLFKTDPAFSSMGAREAITALSKFGERPTGFTSVAPGMGMFVRPTVLPGGRTARLEIGLSNSVSVTKTSGEKIVAGEGAGTGFVDVDMIKSQHLETDVTINTFDLFELSTFSSEHTGLGDRTWRIPVLEGLPFLGGMFHGPRGTISTVHRAVLVVNATVVPRALDLVRRYSN